MKPPKVTLDEVYQEIDLSEFVGEIELSDSLKQSIAQAIIDRIVSRTEAGDGVKIGANGQGRPVKLKSPYSNHYADSLEFKAAGKAKSKVNMTLTGDMLANVDVLSTSGTKIRIGLTDDLQIKKAYNHITGDTVPERPWFGVGKGELKEILAEYSNEIRAAKRQDLPPEGPATQTRLKALDFLSDALGGDDDV